MLTERSDTSAVQSERFSKASRLLRSSDFRFKSFKCLKTESFILYINPKGSGRIGISLSKKILRRSVARNRVRRLIREAFRKNPQIFNGLDVNFSGNPALGKKWKTLELSKVEQEMREIPTLKRGM